jgi:hypothetical protein
MCVNIQENNAHLNLKNFKKLNLIHVINNIINSI